MSEYIGKLVELFREIRRVLKVTGTVWLNLGDTYVSAGGEYAKGGSAGMNSRISKMTLTGLPNDGRMARNLAAVSAGLPMKSLMMIPARVAIALQDDGWILRSEIVWHKPNPMPESVTDRPTKAHEMIYLLSKSPQYFFDGDAIRESLSGTGNGGNFSKVYAMAQLSHGGVSARRDYENRNARSVWTIPTAAVKEAHFATFPQELVRRCILAGCPLDGVVLDPFMGSGTTALVARRLNRRYVGIELNPAYVEMANRRLAQPYQTDMFYHAPKIEEAIS